MGSIPAGNIWVSGNDDESLLLFCFIGKFSCQRILELKNILDEQFNPQEPDAVWCSDITYIWTHEGFVYLTSIMDLYSRKIIAWVLSNTLEAKWIIEAVTKAQDIRGISNPLIIHTDRGCQYVSRDYWC